MEQELIKLGITYGGGTAILIALYFVLKQITTIAKNGDLNKKIQEIEENHLTEINDRLTKLEEDVANIRERVAKLEVKVFNSKKRYNK